eukprot:2842327-Amphidinium_carterae.1
MASCLQKQVKWKLNGVLSSSRTTRRGTPQGCAVSILMFQLQMAPVIAAASKYMAQRCAASKVFAYADDLIFISASADLLKDVMCYVVELLKSLDLEINVLKSSVSSLGTLRVPSIVIDGLQMPVVDNPNLFGSTFAASTIRMPSPGAVPSRSQSRTIGRLRKAVDRLNRLAKLAVTSDAKDLLW